MASQNKDDYCLECHWDAFHLDGREESEKSPEDKQQSELVCPGEEHHTLSRCEEVDEACCDVDECSVTCPSVCDGLVCDEVAACSVSHCDGNNCDENHCDENHCDEDHCDDNHCDENHCDADHCEDEPVCFTDHCFNENETSPDHGLESFLGLGPPLNLETNDFLSSTALGNNSLEHPSKTIDHTTSAGLNPSHHSADPSAFFPSYTSAPAAHCPSHVADHFNCHPHEHLLHPAYPVQNNVNPADVFHMLGMCTDFSNCHVPEEPQHCQHNHQLNGDPSATSLPFSCLHTDHHHLTLSNNHNNLNNHHHLTINNHNNRHHHPVKSPNVGIHAPVKGPCRSHHRCRAHAHAHAHPYSAYSRQSRSSISSHLISSPGETPPPLDGGASSVITSPEFSPVDQDLHVCKWTTNHHGIKTPCGVTFSDSGALQKHLISNHMSTVDGAKGNGYYCCWEGCHRPHEPFSQKSKLQGHFLTHSNYKNFKCPVCGKIFARQATLDRHERSHRGEKPYKCADCGKMFTDSSELKTHSRTHTGEKPFSCTYPGCNFQTGDSSNMSSHRLTHGERRHKCYFPGCTKSFTRPDQLKRHLKSTHKEDSSILSSSPGTEQFALSYGIMP